jgi:phosphate transport system ATP-binding protein
MAPRLDTIGLGASYAGRPVLAGIDLTAPANRVTAIVGGAGTGKTTLLRCLNSLHLATPGAALTGRVLLDRADVYQPGADHPRVRRAIGLVVAGRPVFPTLTVRGNVLAGLRLISRHEREELCRSGNQGRHGRRHRKATEDAVVERALIAAGLWPIAADRLDARLGHDAPPELAWRLCLARTLALDPEVVLLDEPWLGLDRTTAARVDATIAELTTWHTVVMAARDAERAARVAQTVVHLAAEPGGPSRVAWMEPTIVTVLL